MATAVLDASAILAVYLLEPGAEQVAAAMQTAAVCAVNIEEVLSKLADKSASARVIGIAEATLKGLAVAYDFDLARRAARLRPITRSLGLSLGDRACLALGARDGLPVLTADKAWAKLAIGVEIRVIR